MTDPGVRTFQGITVPQAGAYEIDPSHSAVEFVVRHLGLAKVRGRFNNFHGMIEIADDPLASSVEVSIDAGSIDTREEVRDDHLRSPDFLDVGTHPPSSSGPGACAATGPAGCSPATSPSAG